MNDGSADGKSGPAPMENYFDEEVEAATQSVTAAIEPLVIVAMAGIVGTMVIALLMPMMSMYDSLDSM